MKNQSRIEKNYSEPPKPPPPPRPEDIRNNDAGVEFLVKVSLFVSQIRSEENLRDLFIASFGMIKQLPDNTADDYLNTIIQVAKNNKMLGH